jgi:hypothetical protein
MQSRALVILAGSVDLARRVSGQRHAVHHAAEAVIVVNRIVERATIVPERQRADAPIEAAGEFGLGLVLKQEIEQWRTFGLGHILETHRVADTPCVRFPDACALPDAR